MHSISRSRENSDLDVMPRKMKTTGTLIAALAVSLLVGCRSHRVASSQADSGGHFTFPDRVSFDAQMEVFYPDRMGRIPDRFDYLWYSCKATCFAEEQADPELKRYAEKKALEYFQNWNASQDRSNSSQWTESAECASFMLDGLRSLLDVHPDHLRKQDVLNAIKELEGVEKKGITKN